VLRCESGSRLPRMISARSPWRDHPSMPSLEVVEKVREAPWRRPCKLVTLPVRTPPRPLMISRSMPEQISPTVGLQRIGELRRTYAGAHPRRHGLRKSCGQPRPQVSRGDPCSQTTGRRSHFFSRGPRPFPAPAPTTSRTLLPWRLATGSTRQPRLLARSALTSELQRRGDTGEIRAGADNDIALLLEGPVLLQDQ